MNLFNSQIYTETLITILWTFVYIRFLVFDYEKFMCLLSSYRSLPALSFADLTLTPVVVALVIVFSKSWFWFPNSLPMSTAMLRRLPSDMEKSVREIKFWWFFTYHCVDQLHIFLHFLFSIIICDSMKTKIHYHSSCKVKDTLRLSEQFPAQNWSFRLRRIRAKNCFGWTELRRHLPYMHTSSLYFLCQKFR